MRGGENPLPRPDALSPLRREEVDGAKGREKHRGPQVGRRSRHDAQHGDQTKEDGVPLFELVCLFEPARSSSVLQVSKHKE